MEVIAKSGLVQSKNDTCVFVRLRKSVLILGTHVDDGVVAALDEREINELIK